MKVVISFCLSCLALFAVSCVSTKPVEEPIPVTIEEEIIEEYVEIEEVVEVPEPTPEELFIQSLTDVKLEIVQSPKTASYKKAFSSSFKAKVTSSDNIPLIDFPITICYPTNRTPEGLEFSTTEVKSDENGIVEYNSPALNFGIDDFVTFYPTPAFEDEAVISACKALSAQATIKSKSNITTKGALLFVWDFNEKNRPVNNSYEVMAELRSYGITMVGNAPVNESTDIGNSVEKLYKRNYEIVEDAYGYLVIGTVKFVEPVSAVEDGYFCSLISEITVVNMSNGKIVLQDSYTNQATGKNWSAAVSKCKEDLSVTICKDLVFKL